MILDESQKERDIELSVIMNIPFAEIEKLVIASPESIQIYDEKFPIPEKYEDLYKTYDHLNFVAYVKTLMYTSVTRRHSDLIKVLRSTKNEACLDFGSGVGTHAIALMENKNNVSLLDVEGSDLIQFACRRIDRRGLHPEKYYSHLDKLPDDYFKTIICTDVIEHCQNPLNELQRMHKALQSNGILHCHASTMVKPSSGHFQPSIDMWKIEGMKFLLANFERSSETLWVKL